MKRIKFLAFLCAAALLLVMLAGCNGAGGGRPFGLPGILDQLPTEEPNRPSTGDTEAPTAETELTAQTEPTEETAPTPETESSTEADEPSHGLYHFELEKIASVEFSEELEYGSPRVAEGGLYYETQSGQYGILSPDGSCDSGAKYLDCDPLGEYFVVRSLNFDPADELDSVNSYGLVDAYGNVIIPIEFATIDLENEYFARVCQVTGRTENEDEALVYSTDAFFSFQPADGDVLYKGVWYVYDLRTGEKVEGVSGSLPYYIYAYGNYFSYYGDDGERYTVNADGDPLPEDAELYETFYTLEEGLVGTVYDTEDRELFTYELDGHIPSGSAGEYIRAYKYEDGKSSYVLLNREGEAITAEFCDSIRVYGDRILCEDKLYDFDGNQVYDGTCDYVYYNEAMEDLWFLELEDHYTLINRDGEILYTGQETEEIDVLASWYSITKDTPDGRMLYCFRDGDFTVDGYAVLPGIAVVDGPNDTEKLVNFFTGEELLSGYSSYYYGGLYDTSDYICAATGNGIYDIYRIKLN